MKWAVLSAPGKGWGHRPAGPLVLPAQQGGWQGAGQLGPWSSPPSQKNSSQAEDIFAAVTRVLGQAPVDFRGAELLAGKDEGALGWITVNYVLGSLVKVPRAARAGTG